MDCRGNPPYDNEVSLIVRQWFAKPSVIELSRCMGSSPILVASYRSNRDIKGESPVVENEVAGVHSAI